MESVGSIFVSYSHDSPEHVRFVLELSNKLRSEGIDCVLDQYEVSPPEGWPRWMDREIRKATFVLAICTRQYFRRIMGEEDSGVGMGIRWEGGLIYQHLYDGQSENRKFIPVLVQPEDEKYIPTPLRGASRYVVSKAEGYEDLYARLLGVSRAQRPPLGKRRSLPKKEVRTDVSLYISAFIDVDLWNEAGWRGTFFMGMPGRPPILGLGFTNESAARKIFEQWHQRFGDNDQYEELRLAIIEGNISGVDPGYSVHVGSDPDNVSTRYRQKGFQVSRDVLLMFSRINRMDVDGLSPHLEMFKAQFREHKSYVLAPGLLDIEGGRIVPFLDLGIRKGMIYFRDVEEIGENDIDSVVIDGARERTGEK